MIRLIDLATPYGAQAMAEVSLPIGTVSDGTQQWAQAASLVGHPLPAECAAHLGVFLVTPYQLPTSEKGTQLKGLWVATLLARPLD